MPPDAVTVRLARASDAHAMAAMSRDWIESGLAWRYGPQRIAELIADRETVALAACDSAGLQGFAVMEFGETHAHLVLLCVRPGQRRRGIGRRLMEWLTASARVAGIASLHLELRADNKPAHAFYRALGFSQTVLIPGYYDGRIAALRMVHRLRRVDMNAPPPSGSPRTL
jgi:[ribosomal protein S18]-alanine N-acetyltransferase